MKLKVVAPMAAIALTSAGVAQAAGVFGGSDPQTALLKREQALVRSMNGSGGASASRAKRGPRGPRGPRGVKGPAGPAGPAGSFSAITVAKGPTVFLSPFPEVGAVGSSSVNCPLGSRAIGGGWQGGGILATVGYNAPGAGEWSVILTNNNELNSTSFNAVALCAS